MNAEKSQDDLKKDKDVLGEDDPQPSQGGGTTKGDYGLGKPNKK